ncbi:MAG TPA: undecaprenyl-phosphate glucose phosphotransferase [Alphaproteobacteria bacterium]|jgi:Undecaprenyl-phosphate glucose phosphotransferase
MVEVNNELSAAEPVAEGPSSYGEGRRTGLSEETFGNLIAVVDAVIIGAVGLSAYGIYLEWLMRYHNYDTDTVAYVAGITIAVLIASQRFSAARLYALESLRNIKFQVKRLLLAWSSVVIVLVVAAFLLKVSSEFSRVWLVVWYVASAALLVASRFVVAHRLKSWTNAGHYFRAVAVVGAGPLGQRFVQKIQAESGLGLRIVGLFDDRRSRIPAVVEGVPVLGSAGDLIDHVRRGEVDLVVIAMPLSAEGRILHLTQILRVLPVDIRLLSDAAGFNLSYRPVSYWAGIPAINIADKPITGWSFLLKRMSDLLLSAIALAVLLLPLAVVALVVKLDSPGPLFFRQKRQGFNHKLFKIYKFRTMRHEAADLHAERLVTRDDDRVTRVGRFLRRTSIDELPQLWNVLKGDMSLVGPRPHALSAKAADTRYDEAVAQYAERHRVKPGITGWAQVNGWRGETDTLEKIEKRVEYDLYYIAHWSLALDAWILLLTAIKMITGKNAY